MIKVPWRIKESDPALDEALARRLRRTSLTAALLRRRGVHETEAAERFFAPKLLHLHDPFLLPGMNVAVDRIAAAIEAREPIAIFGDYDVDGVSSTCLLYDFFKFLGCPVRYRLPNRLLEGYGLREQSVRSLAAEGVRLIVTVDNGTSAVEEVDLARILGMDVVVTDHHQPAHELPRAVAIVNPWLPGSTYPFQDLAGVGVTFKVVWALCQRLSKQAKLSEKFRRFLLESLALVALGTISDVVPLLGENRVLAKFGLLALQETRRPGLRKLVEAALARDQETRLDASHVGFRMGPRINAAGRLGRAETAIDLLLAEEEGAAARLAASLEEENRRRQQIEREMVETARGLVRQSVDLERDRAIVLGNEGWHAGVLGIVAARIAEEFSRPTFLLTVEGGRARGSARSVPGVHICDALSSVKDLLSGYGGHAMAAGLELDPGLLEDLRQGLNAAIVLRPEEMVGAVEADAEVHLEQLTDSLLDELALLEPFGRGNEEPVFVARGCGVVGEPRLLGGEGKHLAFHVRQGNAVFRAVAFRQGEWLGRLSRRPTQLDLLFQPRVSRWQGQEKLELHVRELAVPV